MAAFRGQRLASHVADTMYARSITVVSGMDLLARGKGICMRTALATLAILSFSATSFAQVAEYRALTGQMIVTGKAVVDPPAGQKTDRVGLFLTGATAKEIFNAIEAKPINSDACGEKLRLKQAGGLICASYKDGSYACSVAILLTTGATKSIWVC